MATTNEPKTLAKRYAEASADTYVGKVRTQQSSTAGAGKGVNFLDGQSRAIFSVDSSTGAPVAPPDDVFQTEFTRNASGAFRYGAPGQRQQTPGSSTSADGQGGLSRWLPKALDISFGAGKHPNLGDGNLYDKYKSFLTSSPTGWAGNPHFHAYTRNKDERFNEVFPVNFGKQRATLNIKPPSPAGILG
jgi:hypothetical protein